MKEPERWEIEGAENLPRLPPGRHGLPREFVARNQRERLAAGVITAVVEQGFHDATITAISTAAGVSRRTFYSYFPTKEAAFLDTYGVVAAHLAEAMAEAGAAESGWARRVHAQIAALLETFAANDDLVRFMLIAPPGAGGELTDAYGSFLESLVAAVAAERPGSAGKRPSEAVEQAMAGGLAALVVAKVNAGEGEELMDLLPDLVELVLTPYIGRKRAVAEARRK